MFEEIDQQHGKKEQRWPAFGRSRFHCRRPQPTSRETSKVQSDEWELGIWFSLIHPLRFVDEVDRRQRASGATGNTSTLLVLWLCSPSSSRASRPRRCCSSSSSTPRLTEKSPPRQISTSTLHSDHCVHYYTSTVLPNLLLLLLLNYHYYYTIAPMLENVHSVSRKTMNSSVGKGSTIKAFGNSRGHRFLQNHGSIYHYLVNLWLSLI